MTKLVQLLKAISETSHVMYMGKPFDLDIAIKEVEIMQNRIIEQEKYINMLVNQLEKNGNKPCI